MSPNCNLDLSHPAISTKNIMTDSSQGTQHQITFSYNARLGVCDVTEFQARAIIWLASRAKEEGNNTSRSDMASISLQSLPHSVPGFSIKKSLQNFLQRRKTRAQATSPYSRTVQ